MATEQPGDEEDGTFDLYDLRVEVVCPPEGTYPMLYLPPGQGFSIYSIGAILPLLAAKQRATARADWMTTDAEVACPDPNCASRLRVIRTGLRRFRHNETTVVPMPTAQGAS
ncbi:hypothetical protein BJY52DRAFT_1248178 [Lactarius psammicola]|nr:hypothetical protein BJY52DRAFT_1248178 [Lactarius psammicola]